MIMMIGIVVLAAAAAFLGISAAFAPKHDLHQRLADLELSDGVERKRGPRDLLQNLLDNDQRGALERRLQEAGWTGRTPRQMVTSSVVGALVGVAMAAGLIFIWGSIDFIPIVGALVFVVCGAYYPFFKLNSAIEKRKKAVQRELPDFLDIVSTTVEAGIALNGAIAIAVDAMSGPLGDELQIALSDIRLGRSRVEALAAMAQRIHQPDVTSTVTAMVQSEKLGGNIASILVDLANEAREKRLMRAEELAAQLPVKMTFPMVFFLLPSLMLMIFGALLADYLHT